MEPGHSIEELAIGLIMLGLLAFSYFFTVYVVLRLARWVDAWWKARRAAGEVAEVPEDFDTQERTSERDDVWTRVQPLDSPYHPGLACLGPGCVHDDWTAWEKELASRPRIQQHLRRMERWSR